MGIHGLVHDPQQGTSYNHNCVLVSDTDKTDTANNTLLSNSGIIKSYLKTAKPMHRVEKHANTNCASRNLLDASGLSKAKQQSTQAPRKVDAAEVSRIIEHSCAYLGRFAGGNEPDVP